MTLDDGSDASTSSDTASALPQTPSVDDLRNPAASASVRGGNASKRGGSIGVTLRPRNTEVRLWWVVQNGAVLVNFSIIEFEEYC